jgi:hypothetical protein
LLPDDLTLVGVMEPGEAAEGTVCLVVPAEAIDGLVLSLRTIDALGGGTRAGLLRSRPDRGRRGLARSRLLSARGPAPCLMT